MKSESKIQAEIVAWYHNNFCLPIHTPRQLILHVPNQGQFKLINIGVYPGASDLIIVHNKKIYMIEVKEPDKGRQSDSQIKFEAHCLQSCIPYFIVYSLDDFKKIIFAL